MQTFTKRSVLRSAVIAALPMAASGATFAQSYPTRPIRLVVPSSAGAGVTDIMARLADSI
jgi:tripartite-type tricarboxylate transporter receptor subunit TctC